MNGEDGRVGDPLVSFIIPSYRGADILPACLHTVLGQRTCRSFEIIVVDDGSRDESAEMVRRNFPGVKVVERRRNRGPAAAKNLGAAEAAGRYLAFLDNDVELHPDWLEAMVSRLEREREAGACASHILLHGEGAILNSTGGMVNLLGYAWDRGIFNPDSGSYRFQDRVMYACSAAMMARREAFEEAGGFDERFRYLFEDADLGWRMNLMGYKVLYEPRAVAWHRLSSTMGGRWLRNLYLYERNRLRSLLKNMEGGSLRWMGREVVYWYFRRMYVEMENGVDLRTKFLLPLRMFQALAWNLLHLPGTMALRRRVKERRRVPDRVLLFEGLLCPQVGEPPMDRNPRDGSRVGTGRKVFRRRVMVAREPEWALGPGWYGREEDPHGIPFRWMGEKASLAFEGKRRGRQLVLRTVMAHPRGLSQVAIRVNGRRICVVEVPNRPHVHRIRIPEGVKGTAWEVELEVLNPFRPRDVLGIEDQRLLGVAVVSVGMS